MNSFTLAEIADIVLGARGVQYGFIQPTEALEEHRGKKQQQGFDTGHRRVTTYRVFLHTGKSFYEATDADWFQAVTKAFAGIGYPVPEILKPEVLTEREALTTRRARLTVVCTSCAGCGDDRVAAEKRPGGRFPFAEAERIHVRLGNALRPVQLLLCDKCAKQQPKPQTV
jgi:hypothetical protein